MHRMMFVHMITFFVDHSRFVQDQMTPLHHAGESGHEEVVSLLLENGAQIDAEDKVCSHHFVNHSHFQNKNTSLYFAASNGHMEVFSFLLEKGAQGQDKVSINYSQFDQRKMISDQS